VRFDSFLQLERRRYRLFSEEDGKGAFGRLGYPLVFVKLFLEILAGIPNLRFGLDVVIAELKTR
jgi:hypothetical protein